MKKTDTLIFGKRHWLIEHYVGDDLVSATWVPTSEGYAYDVMEADARRTMRLFGVDRVDVYVAGEFTFGVTA